jgi:hypothetical protein
VTNLRDTDSSRRREGEFHCRSDLLVGSCGVAYRKVRKSNVLPAPFAGEKLGMLRETRRATASKLSVSQCSVKNPHANRLFLPVLPMPSPTGDAVTLWLVIC